MGIVVIRVLVGITTVIMMRMTNLMRAPGVLAVTTVMMMLVVLAANVELSFPIYSNLCSPWGV